MIRVCHPHDFDGFNYVVDKTGRLGGPLGALLNKGLGIAEDYIATKGVNLSIVIQRSEIFNVTDRSSLNYEGCLEGLQSNQSDVYLGLADYPQASENVSQGQIVLDTSLVIGSMYTKEKAETTQVLSSFTSFSITVWSVCVVSLLCLSLLLKVRNSMGRQRVRQNHYNFLYMATHLVRLGSIDDTGFARKLIFITASVFSLIVVHYFSSFIKTELLTIKDPKVFRSYQDIIDREAMPTFAKGMFYDLMFKRPDAPSYRKKLWRYSTTTFREEDLYIEIDPAGFLLGAIAVLIQKQVVIVDSILMPMIPNTGCAIASRDPNTFLTLFNQLRDHPGVILPGLTDANAEAQKKYSERFLKKHRDRMHFDSMPDFNFFTAVDPDEMQYNLGVLVGSGATEQVKSLIHKLIRLMVESGRHLIMREELSTFNLMNGRGELTDLFGPVDKSRSYLVQECTSCTIVRPDIGFHPLTLRNFHSLFMLMAAIIPCLFLVLAIERKYAH